MAVEHATFIRSLLDQGRPMRIRYVHPEPGGEATVFLEPSDEAGSSGRPSALPKEESAVLAARRAAPRVEG